MNNKIIKNELRRVTQFNKENFGEIYLSQKYKSDTEWWVLGKFCYCLENAQKMYPIFAHKRKNTNPPDFETFDNNNIPFGYFEITEVMKPGRKRSDEYKNNTIYNSKAFEYDIKNINELLICLNKKLKCQYTKTDLIVRINVNINDFSKYGAWHWVVNNSIKKWIQDDKLNFDVCSFNNIYILDSNGERLFQIFPFCELIHTPEDVEWNYALK